MKRSEQLVAALMVVATVVVTLICVSWGAYDWATDGPAQRQKVERLKVQQRDAAWRRSMRERAARYDAQVGWFTDVDFGEPVESLDGVRSALTGRGALLLLVFDPVLEVRDDRSVLRGHLLHPILNPVQVELALAGMAGPTNRAECCWVVASVTNVMAGKLRPLKELDALHEVFWAQGHVIAFAE